jgi:hypothetical protein
MERRCCHVSSLVAPSRQDVVWANETTSKLLSCLEAIVGRRRRWRRETTASRVLAAPHAKDLVNEKPMLYPVPIEWYIRAWYTVGKRRFSFHPAAPAHKIERGIGTLFDTLQAKRVMKNSLMAPLRVRVVLQAPGQEAQGTGQDACFHLDTVGGRRLQ